MQQSHALEIVCRFQTRMLPAEGRAGDRQKIVIHQFPRFQIRVIQRIVADRHMHAAARKSGAIQRMEFRSQTNVNFRMAAHEPTQAGHQPAQRKGRRTIDVNRRGRRSHGANRLFDTTQCRFDFVLQANALAGQLQAAWQSMKEHASGPLLKLPDLLTHRTLAEIQLLARAGEAVVAGGRFKTTQPSKHRRSQVHVHYYC